MKILVTGRAIPNSLTAARDNNLLKDSRKLGMTVSSMVASMENPIVF